MYKAQLNDARCRSHFRSVSVGILRWCSTWQLTHQVTRFVKSSLSRLPSRWCTSNRPDLPHFRHRHLSRSLTNFRIRGHSGPRFNPQPPFAARCQAPSEAPCASRARRPGWQPLPRRHGFGNDDHLPRTSRVCCCPPDPRSFWRKPWLTLAVGSGKALRVREGRRPGSLARPLRHA